MAYMCFYCIVLLQSLTVLQDPFSKLGFNSNGNWDLPYIQAGFRKGRRTRDQIANTHWITEKAREFQKNIYLCFTDYTKAFDYLDHNKLWRILRDGNIRLPYLPSEKPVCRSGSNSLYKTWNNILVQTWERSMSRLYIVTLLI